jgi:hypothetical protein
MPWRVIIGSFVAQISQDHVGQQHELAFGSCH